MQKYKLIVLIISSSDQPIYIEMKQISNEYMKLYNDQVKHFYIEFDPELQQPIKEDGNTLYFKGTDSAIPGIFYKSILAMEYINAQYDYDFAMRTNLSSFLDMNKLLTFLDSKPTENFAGGFNCADAFITGTGIFLSKDVVNKLVYVDKYDINIMIPDDVLISQLIRKCQVPIQYIDDEYFPINFTEATLDPNQPFNPDIKYPDNIIYFRIKYQPDRNIDVMYFKLLLKQIYNIDYNA